MIETDKRKAVFLLHQEGQPVAEIARLLALSPNTVRVIIQQGGASPPRPARADKQRLDEELLRRLYQECQGWMVRVHEKLLEEEGVKVTYSTLNRRLRELGISHPPQTRCQQVPDEPGAEMQHDTSPYQVELAGRRVRLIASLIYLRYSKRRYLRFYRAFDRFKMKCFFHEALMFWGYSAPRCIIDNTNLARLRGTGANAVIVPEMETFAKQYGFEYRCHELQHANRKAGEERSFWTVETNFLPGRTFQSLEDLNEQSLAWSTVRLDQKLLRALAPAVSAYLDYALPTKGLARHQFLRRLLALSRKMSVELFGQTVERARKYRITDLETLQNIAWLYLQQGPGQVPLVEIDAAFREREAYQEGSLTDPPELPPDPEPADQD
jgi:transposase